MSHRFQDKLLELLTWPYVVGSLTSYRNVIFKAQNNHVNFIFKTYFEWKSMY